MIRIFESQSEDEGLIPSRSTKEIIVMEEFRENVYRGTDKENPDYPYVREGIAPVHYVEKYNRSIEWLPHSRNMSTVLEFNTWEGNSIEEVEKTRKVVLMETNHDAILAVSELIIKGDPAALDLLVRSLDIGLDAHLGYCFKSNRPRLLVHSSAGE